MVQVARTRLTRNISPAQALEIAKAQGISVTYPTILKWVRDYGLGYRIGGRYTINREKFMKFIEGQKR